MKRRSPGEEALAWQLKVKELPEPEREYRFHGERRWRFDFAWPDRMLACEVEGGTYSGGRHTRAKGFEADCEKYNRASLDGWTVLRVTTAQVRSGVALGWLEEALS